MSFFSLDSKFSQIMGRVFDLMMLNIIFLIMIVAAVILSGTLPYYVYPDCDNRRQFHSNVLRHAEDDQK